MRVRVWRGCPECVRHCRQFASYAQKMYNTHMKPICIMKDCGRSVHARGLCFNCYTTFRFHVNKGTITDRHAVELGLVLQSKGRSASSPFAIKLRALFPNKMPS